MRLESSPTLGSNRIRYPQYDTHIQAVWYGFIVWDKMSLTALDEMLDLHKAKLSI